MIELCVIDSRCPSYLAGGPPANTKHLYIIYTMLGQRRRRWADVVLALQDQDTRDVEPMLVQCWGDVEDGGLTLIQHWFKDSAAFLCTYHTL